MAESGYPIPSCWFSGEQGIGFPPSLSAQNGRVFWLIVFGSPMTSWERIETPRAWIRFIAGTGRVALKWMPFHQWNGSI